MDIPLYCHVWCIKQLITNSGYAAEFNQLKVDWLHMRIFRKNLSITY